ncbi:hypothetical protein AB0425_17760 [Actinosynnema sp. NPDC051121]
MTTYDTITLGLGNRDKVIDFINRDGEAHHAHEPDDSGSDVVIVDRHDHNRAVVILGDTVRRSADQFEIIREGEVRNRFPRVASGDDNPLSVIEQEMDAAIADAQANLAAALNDVTAALNRARVQLTRLNEGPAWHPDYAETADGMDADTELAAAERSVRHVQRIAREISAREVTAR